MKTNSAVKKTTNQLSETADSQGTRRVLKTETDSLEQEYVNQVHVDDFLKALRFDPLVSDVNPTQSKKYKKKLREQEASKPKGISHTVLQYPLIAMIGFIMVIELIAYISLRQIVRIWENVFSWRGKRKILRENLRAAKTYNEWCEAADALDKHMHKDAWKKTVPSAYYDYRLLQKVVRHLKTYRQSDSVEDAAKLMDVLYVCLKQNFAGIENSILYSNTYLGTKTLIEEYVDEVTLSIDSISNNPNIPVDEKNLAFKLYSKNYGRTAFCLSGGAGFGYYHLGVIRALLDRGLFPPIITGTSSGSLMSAIVCTRTNSELSEILNPGLAKRINICHESWSAILIRFIKTGALFDAEHWCREAMWFTKGSLTFKEAYDRTGRMFNVSVVPYDQHSPPKLLNYITAPDCVIWSAVLASAAIPGILNPVVLMQKKPGSEHLTPYNYGHKFKDGSLKTDIPTLALKAQFNVNYTIVSQVNPHIHVFFYANQGSPGRPVAHRQGRGWRGGFLASTIEQMLKLDLAKWLKVLRHLKLLPTVYGQDWSSVWLQKFDGNVTILPKSNFSDWFQLLTDPDEQRLETLILSSQLRTWPKISMISNRMRIEAVIEKTHKSLRQTYRTRRNNRTNKDINRLIQQFDNSQDIPRLDHGSTSDEASGDEMVFLARRRASLPSDQSVFFEQNRRRKFMAQFSDQVSTHHTDVFSEEDSAED